ncbi:unnamed protein product [Dibothriocephalus latus]|uniref:Uncharacterized protein n=1 Tax=Dibothriocephalus latus TaxID=60516 RepID=A0A3P6QJI6_DIBLA|nr:unnamed protein product [Dibothriocephalus latus]
MARLKLRREKLSQSLTDTTNDLACRKAELEKWVSATEVAISEAKKTLQAKQVQCEVLAKDIEEYEVSSTVCVVILVLGFLHFLRLIAYLFRSSRHVLFSYFGVGCFSTQDTTQLIHIDSPRQSLLARDHFLYATLCLV